MKNYSVPLKKCLKHLVNKNLDLNLTKRALVPKVCLLNTGGRFYDGNSFIGIVVAKLAPVRQRAITK